VAAAFDQATTGPFDLTPASGWVPPSDRTSVPSVADANRDPRVPFDPDPNPGTVDWFGQQYQRLYQIDSDPANEDKRLASIFLARALNQPDSTVVYANYPQMVQQYTGKTELPQSFRQAVQAQWRRTWIDLESSKLDLMLDSDNEEKWKRFEELQAERPPEDTAKRNLIGSAVLAAEQFLPYLADSAAAHGIWGAGGALLGGLVGTAVAGPAGGAAGARLGARIGGPAGTFFESSRLEAEGIFQSIMTMTVPATGQPIYKDPELRGKIAPIARAFSIPFGAVAGGLEAVGFETLAGSKALREVVEKVAPAVLKNFIASGKLQNAFTRFLSNYVKNTATETVTETMQTLVEQLAKDLATETANEREKLGIPTGTFAEYVRMMRETAVTTFLGTSVIGAPAAVRETVAQGRERGAERRAAAATMEQEAAAMRKLAGAARLTPNVPDFSAVPETQRLSAAEQHVAETRAALESLLNAFDQDPATTPARTVRQAEMDLQASEAVRDEIAQTGTQGTAATETWRVPRADYLNRSTGATESLAAQSTPREGTAQGGELSTPIVLTDEERSAIEPVRAQIAQAFRSFDAEQTDLVAMYVVERARHFGVPVEQYAPTFRAVDASSDPRFQGKRGGFAYERIGDGLKAVVYATSSADVSTAVHEITHGEYDLLSDEDRATVREYAVSLGEQHPDAEAFRSGKMSEDVYAREAFSTAVEQYLGEKRAPAGRFGEIVRRIGDFIRSVYRRLGASLPNLTPKMRGLLDQHFGVTAEAAPAVVGPFDVGTAPVQARSSAEAPTRTPQPATAPSPPATTTPAAPAYQPDPGWAHEDEVRRAVAEGKPVPDEVLEDYKDRPWAAAEIKQRAELRDEARVGAYPSGEAFAFAMADRTLDEDLKDAEYYVYLWEQSQRIETMEDVELGNRRFVDSLSREHLEALLLDISHNKDTPELAGRELPRPVLTAIAAIEKEGTLSLRAYQELLAAIRTSPLRYRVAIEPFLNDDWKEGQRETEAEVDLDNTEVAHLKDLVAAASKQHPALRRSVDSILRQVEGARRAEARAAGAAEALEIAQTAASKEIAALKEEFRGKLREARAAGEERLRAVRAEYQARLAELRRKGQERVKAARAEERQKTKERYEKARAAAQAKRYVEKLVQSILRPPSTTVDFDYAQQILEEQNNLEVRESPVRKRILRGLRKWVKAHPEMQLSPEDQAFLQTRSIRELTIPELESIKAKIDSLRSEGRKVLQEKRLERLRKVVADRDAIVGELSPGGMYTPTQARSSKAGKEQQRGSVKHRAEAVSWNIARLVEQLGPTARRVFWEDINGATDAELRALEKVILPAKEKLKELGITAAGLAREIDVDGHVYNHQQAMGVYCISKNEDGLSHLVHGENITMGQISKLIGQLTPQERAYGDFIMETFGGQNWDRLNRAYIEDTNRSSVKVENYFPFRNDDIRHDSFRLEAKNDLTSRAGLRRAYPSKSFMKLRQKGAGTQIRLDAINLFFEQLHRQEHYIASWGVVKHAQRVLAEKKVRDVIVQRFGAKYLEAVAKDLDSYANPLAFKAHDSLQSVMKAIRGGTTVGALAFNPMTWANQIPGFLLYLGEAGPMHLMSAVGQVMTNFRATYDFVLSRDPQLKNRDVEGLASGLRNIDEAAWKRYLLNVGEIGMRPLEFLDRITCVVGWKAVYDANIHLGEEAAVKAAQEATLRTQPASQSKDLPLMYQSEAGKMFLMFTRPLIQVWNMMSADWPRLAKQGKLANVLLEAFALAATGIVMGALRRKRAPDDPKEAALDVASQFVTGIPFVGGELMSALYGSWYAGRGVALTGGVVADAVRSGAGLLDDRKTAAQKMMGIARLAPEIARVLGIPAKPLTMTLNVITAARQDEPWAWELLGGPPAKRKE
jgi:hypothetical protein